MKFLRGPLFFSLLAVVLVSSAFWPTISDSEKEAVVISTILKGLDRMHYNPPTIDDSFSEKVYDLYLDRIDGGRRFLTKEDVAKLEEFKLQLDDEANEGTFQFFDLSQELLNASLDKTQEYYRSALANPFNFDEADTYVNEGDEKGFAENDDELKANWMDWMKYETLTRLNDKLEAQEKLLNPEPAKEGEEVKEKTEEKLKEEEELKNKSVKDLEADARKATLKVFDDWYKRLRKLKRSDRMSDYLNSMTNVFDPHTGYFEPIDKQNFDIGMSGKLEGIGARLQTQDEYTKVTEVVVGGPAWKGKSLEANDLIMKVAQGDEEPVDITGMQINDVVKLIRGPKGTEVNLTVKKQNGAIEIVNITRDVVVMEEGFAKSLLLNTTTNGDKVGYIKLPRFYADFDDANGRFCSTDVAAEIEKLKGENVEGIILDLRNNGGGSLRDVVKMSGYFIENGPIVQVKSRQGSPEILSDRDPGVLYDGPLIVMVNEFSASASEILAAALQDYERAVIVGSNSTFGKGTVQRFFNLDRAVAGNQAIKPLGSIKLTTQKFYRVDGGSTQLKGVEPDIVFPDNYKYIETGEKENDHSMAWTEIPSVKFSQDVYNIGNMNALIAKSNRRVETNEIFQKIEKKAVRLKKQRDRSEFPMELRSFRAWDDELEKESKMYKDLFTSIDELSAVNLPVDVEAYTSAESKKARNDDWLKNIKKDVYLFETLNIMHDMLSQKVVDNNRRKK